MDDPQSQPPQDRARFDVGVVGLGQIGGSVALAALRAGMRAAGFDSNPGAMEFAAAGGVSVSGFADVAMARTVFVAVPPKAVESTLEKLAAAAAPDSVITDCTSVKAEVAAVADAIPGLAGRFVGGHPMAGTAGSGHAAATATMFEGAVWVLCLAADARIECVARVENVVARLGARAVSMDPVEHDRHVAQLSHVPHVLAACLSVRARALDRPDIAAGSWRDLTRVADSDPDLWAQIVEANALGVSESLRELAGDMNRFADALDKRDWDAVRQTFSAGRDARRAGTR